jgi:hypothetical protein
MDEPPAEVSEDLALLPHAFGQQSLGSPTVSLNIKKLSHPDGAWRLRSGDWRSLFFQTGDDFLVAAIGPRRDIYERLPKIRLARWAGGIRILETPTEDRSPDTRGKREPVVRQARRPKPADNNGLSPFDDAMLRSIVGVDDDVLTAPWWVPRIQRCTSEATRCTCGSATCAGSPLPDTFTFRT